MSKKNMLDFLTKLKEELRKNSKFRAVDANVAQNTFYYSPTRLKNELASEFAHRDLQEVFNQETLQNFLKIELKNVLKVLQENARTKLQNRTGVTLQGNQHYMLACIQTEINPKTDKGFDNFRKLKTLYQDKMNEFTTKLIEHLEENYATVLKKSYKKRWNDGKYDPKIAVGNTPISKHSDLWEGGHEEGSQILESKITASINNAFEAYDKVATVEEMNANLKVLGIDLRIARNDNDGTYIFGLQSKWDNQAAGIKSATDRKKFNEQLENAIKKLGEKGAIPNLKGSPSLLEIKNSALLIDTLAPFHEIKGVKITKPKVLKKKKRAPVTKKTDVKPKKVAMSVGSIVVKKIHLAKAKKRKESSAASQPLHLVAMINKDLPDAVKKNMRSPALVNRTGRFAESVRVTDVVQTPKGFPSFGYTYQKNPYQVFEDGAGKAPWADGDRDPRELIDRSMREIAARLAVGRFYTRRL